MFKFKSELFNVFGGVEESLYLWSCCYDPSNCILPVKSFKGIVLRYFHFDSIILATPDYPGLNALLNSSGNFWSFGACKYLFARFYH